jgi:hypothetical protein
MWRGSAEEASSKVDYSDQEQEQMPEEWSMGLVFPPF